MGAFVRGAAFFVLGKVCDFVLQERGNVVLERVRVRALTMSARLAAWAVRKKAQMKQGMVVKDMPPVRSQPANVTAIVWWQVDVGGKCIRPVRLMLPKDQPPLLKYFRRPRWLLTVSLLGVDGKLVDPKDAFERPEDAAKYLSSQL